MKEPPVAVACLNLDGARLVVYEGRRKLLALANGSRFRPKPTAVMTHWLEGIFEFLFKYRPAEFAKGSFAFGAPFSVIVLLLAAAAIGVPAVMSYAGVRGKRTRRDRWVLGTRRLASLAVLVACLFRPMLLLSAAVPQRNYVGVLLDD